MSKKVDEVTNDEQENVVRDFYEAIHKAGLDSLIPPDSVRVLDAGLPGVNIGVNSLQYMIAQLLKLELTKASAMAAEATKKSNPLLEQAFEECHSTIVGYTPSRLLVRDAS